VLYFGSSNHAGWHIAQANETARRRGSLGLIAEQSLYNLAVRDIEREVVPACEAYGVGIIPWSPLQSGILGGVLAKDAEGDRRRSRSDEVERRRPQLEKWEAFCAELGEQPADVALAWLLSRPAVTAPIVGPRTMAQLDGSLRALEVTLEDDALARIDEIWPGYKTAPEDYAW
jgi:aryl-alcohol dehydrogenase-like predicted oxidoreductase